MVTAAADWLLSDLECVVPEAPALITGGVRDMWQLYKAAACDKELLFNLVVFDTITARDGLLFPDFFRAVNSLLRNQPSGSGSQLEAELEETFSAMHRNWSILGPFFDRHPELRYLNRHSAFGHALKEFADKLPSLRSLAAPLFWSLSEYCRSRDNLNAYALLDEELLKQPAIGTLFERAGGEVPGEVRINLRPYGPQGGEIAPYLRLLKHGDLIGFGRIARASTEGKTFVALTSLQTDLLRKDSVRGMRQDLELPTTFFPDVKRNESGGGTIPTSLSKRNL